MAAPTNISFATATALGTLPASVVQTVDFSGTTYTVFYSFIAPAGATVIGAFGFGDLTTYQPTIAPYDHSQVSVLTISLQNKPIQFPVTPGDLYYLKFTPNGGNPSPAILTIDVEVAPDLDVPVGSIAVNDDTPGFPLAFVSGTLDNTILAFKNDIPAGEAGDVLIDGTVLLEDLTDGTGKLYDPSNYALQATITMTSNVAAIRTCLGANIFYMATGGNPPKFCTVTGAGVKSSETSLTGSVGLVALAADNDQAILYHGADTAANLPVRKWDIVNGVALADLVAGIAAYRIGDILVLGDDSILVGYWKATATADYQVKRYSAAGATLSTYALGTYETSLSSPPRLAYAIDDPNSFWVMQHRTSVVGTTAFKNIKVSDGSTLTTRIGVLYGGGLYRPTATATPIARFGSSPSCPFWVTRATTAPPVPAYEIVPRIIRRLRRVNLT